MAASHQSVSATGQQVARDLAPLIPGLPTPPPGGAQSDPQVGYLCQTCLGLGHRGEGELEGFPRAGLLPPWPWGSVPGAVGRGLGEGLT